MRVLVLNSGSSSLKFRLFDVPGVKAGGSPQVGRAVTQGAVKGIGGTAPPQNGGAEEPPVPGANEGHVHPHGLGGGLVSPSGKPPQQPRAGSAVTAAGA